VVLKGELSELRNGVIGWRGRIDDKGKEENHRPDDPTQRDETM
jgi:hypothetical protein